MKSRLLAGALALQCTTPCLANDNVTGVQFSVTEGGAATLSIPIKVPRGIGGMEPQLSLNYSSGAGNGLLGIGWSLHGVSAITRCPQNRALDGVRGTVAFNSGDRFCLDGQRLVLVNPADPNSATLPNQATYGAASTEYRTERDSFSRITAIGQFQPNVPLGFRVETKSGLILEFGNIVDPTAHNSQVLTNFAGSWLPAARPETINRWMLRRIRDRMATPSTVEFEYCKGEVTPAASAPVPSVLSSCTPGSAWSGSAPLHYIRYTNRGTTPGTMGVVVRYDTRDDLVQTFHAGSAARQTQRISAIQTFIGFTGPGSPGTLVRSYDVSYEGLKNAAGASVRATNASRIAKIQERGVDGPTIETLPAVTFSMAQDSVFDRYVVHEAAAVTPTLPLPRGCGGAGLNSTPRMCP
jgi:Salmonella virulence plasmid 65kDa B protein